MYFGARVVWNLLLPERYFTQLTSVMFENLQDLVYEVRLSLGNFSLTKVLIYESIEHSIFL